MGSSGLKLFRECPYLYYAFYIDPRGKKHKQKTTSQTLGSHAHVSLLEPEQFKKEYLISPQYTLIHKGKKNQSEVELNKKHGAWDRFILEAQMLGKIPILWSEYEDCCEMTAHLMTDPLAKACLSGIGQNECSFFVRDSKTGIMRKARPDRVIDLQGFNNYRYVIVDYKTTALSISEETQSKYIYNERRFLQAACHKSVVEEYSNIKIDKVIYITQMAKYPYLVKCYEMPDEDIQLGYDEMRNLIEGYSDYKGVYHKGFAQCMQDGIWPGYPGGITPYVRPSWMNYQYS